MNTTEQLKSEMNKLDELRVEYANLQQKHIDERQKIVKDINKQYAKVSALVSLL